MKVITFMRTIVSVCVCVCVCNSKMFCVCRMMLVFVE